MQSTRSRFSSTPSAAANHIQPVRDGVLATLLIVVAALAASLVFYLHSKDALENEVREDLRRVARLAATFVDGDLHRTFTHPAQEFSPEYARAIEPLARIQTASEELRFVYTCVLVDDEVRFVLDPTEAGDSDGDGTDDKSHIHQVYGDASDAMLAALREQKNSVEQAPYTDPWGTFISGYAPFYDGKGEFVGVVGVDLDAHRFVARLDGMRRAALFSTSAACALGVFFGWMVYLLQRRARERELRIDDMLGELEVSCHDAKVAVAARTAFLSTVSHELRTPLNGVIGMNDLLLETALDDDQRELASTVKTSAGALLSIVDDVLTYSQAQSGRLRIDAIAFDAVSSIEEVVEHCAPRVYEKGLDIAVRTTVTDLPQVLGDPYRLRQVVLGLLSNAIKFTRTGHVLVTLQATLEGDDRLRLCIDVEDTGIGIPADRLGEIFDEFAQLDSSTTRAFGGTGLGLAICRQLTQLMGGRLTVTSREGEGSCFRLEVALPVAADVDHSHGPTAQFSNAKSLVIVERMLPRVVLSDGLARRRARVVSAVNARDGAAQLDAAGSTNEPYELVIADACFVDDLLALNPCEGALVVRLWSGLPDEKPKPIATASNVVDLRKPARASVIAAQFAAFKVERARIES
ncbi:MAG: hypothetical protein IPH13_22610 [Planctomycetes bacterium]|nr:hypothetical protein [Planctomycetota bacterium]MCC7170352.1 hypothetical protein [Planctomycetota bacterium]